VGKKQKIARTPSEAAVGVGEYQKDRNENNNFRKAW
jgi:hypothetical protein